MNKSSNELTSQVVQRLQYYVAFDFGSGLFKMVVGIYNFETGRIEKICAEKMISVQLANDFRNNGTISKETEQKAIEALIELVELAKKTVGNNDYKIRGIATATFRDAGTKGVELLQKLKDIVGDKNFIQVIDSKTEGELGLRTARVIAVEENPELKILPKIAFDTGNASFQIPYEVNDVIKVLAGSIGASHIGSLYVTKILGYEKYDYRNTKYEVVNKEQILNTISMLKNYVPEPLEDFSQVLKQENYKVTTIGDGGSVFAIIKQALGNNSYSIEDIGNLLDDLVECKNPEEKFKSVAVKSLPYVVPSAAFLYAVMEKLGIKSLEYYTTAGCTKGMLDLKDLWKD